MHGLEITPLKALTDNYVFVLRDKNTGQTAVIDPTEAPPVLALCKERGIKLDYIVNTHHHGDHVGGNGALKAHFGCKVFGPDYDTGRIPHMDQGLRDGDTFTLGKQEAKVLHIPGHTTGHIALWFGEAKALFCGDTLFALGCGRLFEGTAEQMLASLSRLADLPDDTLVYCAHEYTEANGRFALTVDPDNAALHSRFERVLSLRAASMPTVPSRLGEERATNPYLRTSSASLRKTLNMPHASNAEVLAEVRRRKDHFRS